MSLTRDTVAEFFICLLLARKWARLASTVTLTIEEWKIQQQLVLEGLPEQCHWQPWDSAGEASERNAHTSKNLSIE